MYTVYWCILYAVEYRPWQTGLKFISALNPSMHSHSKLPALLVHVPLFAQTSSRHSSMSADSRWQQTQIILWTVLWACTTWSLRRSRQVSIYKYLCTPRTLQVSTLDQLRCIHRCRNTGIPPRCLYRLSSIRKSLYPGTRRCLTTSLFGEVGFLRTHRHVNILIL